MATKTVRLLVDYTFSGVQYRADDLVIIDSSLATALETGGIVDTALEAIKAAMGKGKVVNYPNIDSAQLSTSIDGYSSDASRVYIDKFGDSMAGKENQTQVLDNTYTATVENNIITITQPNTNWLYHPGTMFYLMNTPDDNYVALYTVIEGTTSLVIKARCAWNIPNGSVDFSNISLGGSSNSPALCRLFRPTHASILSHACAYSNGSLVRGYSIGFYGRNSGYITQDKIDKFLGWIPNKKNRILVYIMGINDIFRYGLNDTDTLNSNIANLQLLKTLGYKKIVVCTIGPVNHTTHTGYTSARRNYELSHNSQLKLWIDQNPEFLLHDQFALIRDPASIYADNAANTLEDHVHLNGYGAEISGKGLWNNVLSKIGLPNFSLSPQSVADGHTNISAQLFNGIFNLDITTGAIANAGLLSGGATGIVKSGFTLTKNSATSVVGSMPANADGNGYDQQIVFSTSAADQGFTFASTAATTGRINAGDTLRIFQKIKLEGCTNLKSLSINFTVTYGGIIVNLSPVYPSTLKIDSSDRTVTYEFGHIGYIAPGDCDYSYSISCTTDAAGGGTITIGAPSGLAQNNN